MGLQNPSLCSETMLRCDPHAFMLFGLWAFDLAVSQMLQERVSKEQLGGP